jgi:hypothetical protein
LVIAQPLSEGEKYGMTSIDEKRRRLQVRADNASSAPLLIPHNRPIRDCGGNVKIKIAGADC